MTNVYAMHKGTTLKLATDKAVPALLKSGWQFVADDAGALKEMRALHGKREPYAAALKAPKKPAPARAATPRGTAGRTAAGAKGE